MKPRAWLEDNGPVYVVLLVASSLGVALLISYTVLKIAGTSFESIDPTVVAVLTIILAVMAGEHSKPRQNENEA